jgi:hypothetical protein
MYSRENVVQLEKTKDVNLGIAGASLTGIKPPVGVLVSLLRNSNLPQDTKREFMLKVINFRKIYRQITESEDSSEVHISYIHLHLFLADSNIFNRERAKIK